MQGVRADLQRAGHIVTSRWIDLAKEVEADALKCAFADTEDIEAAEILIGFPDPPRSTSSRGGHFFEEGFADALGKRVVIVGHRSHIFHHLFEFFPSWQQALEALTPHHKEIQMSDEKPLVSVYGPNAPKAAEFGVGATTLEEIEQATEARRNVKPGQYDKR